MLVPKRNVWIDAPPAIFHVARGPITEPIPPPGLDVSKDDVIQMQQTEIRVLREEIERVRVAANTIANTAACLAALAEPDDDGWVRVPREMRERMRNSVQLQVRHSPDATMLRWVTRAPDHLLEGKA